MIYKKERVGKLLEEKYSAHPYIFPAKTGYKLGGPVEEVLQQAIIQKSLAYVNAYATADRRSESVKVRAKGIDLFDTEYVDVPVDIVTLQENILQEESKPEEEQDLAVLENMKRELGNYFSNES